MGDDRIRGTLISFEGLEKVGKTTQIRRLALWLRSLGHTVTVLREPGGTMLGETLRGMLLHTVQIHSAAAEFLLFAAARAELVATVIQPALEEGQIVILDRYGDSSAAYQGFGRGLEVKWITLVNEKVTAGVEPDMTFWLRGPSFAVGDDNIESQDQGFFARVEEGYETLASQNPARWHIIPSARPADAVSRDIQAAVRETLNIG